MDGQLTTGRRWAADVRDRDGLAPGQVETGLGVAGFVKSTGEARRQIKGGGIKVNDETVKDEKRLLTLEDLTEEGAIKLSLGKKRHVLVRPV